MTIGQCSPPPRACLPTCTPPPAPAAAPRASAAVPRAPTATQAGSGPAPHHKLLTQHPGVLIASLAQLLHGCRSPEAPRSAAQRSLGAARQAGMAQHGKHSKLSYTTCRACVACTACTPFRTPARTGCPTRTWFRPAPAGGPARGQSGGQQQLRADSAREQAEQRRSSATNGPLQTVARRARGWLAGAQNRWEAPGKSGVRSAHSARR